VRGILTEPIRKKKVEGGSYECRLYYERDTKKRGKKLSVFREKGKNERLKRKEIGPSGVRTGEKG